MSSSFKQKKMKTLATRKKTRKRRMEQGLTHEDDSGRLFQPPSKRDPRWKKPTVDALVSGMSASKRRKLEVQEDAEDSDDEVDFPSSSDEDSHQSDGDGSDNSDSETEQSAAKPKPRIHLCSSLDDCVAKAEAMHRAIRRDDGRQKAKVLLLVDSRPVFKAIKAKMGIRAEPVKGRSRVGIRSQKKNLVAFRHIGAVKTPLDRFEDANKDVLRDFKSGKLPTLLAEDVSFFPYADLKLQHVVFVAKKARAMAALDRSLLDELSTHFVLLNDNPELPSEDREALEAAGFALS